LYCIDGSSTPKSGFIFDALEKTSFILLGYLASFGKNTLRMIPILAPVAVGSFMYFGHPNDFLSNAADKQASPT